MQNMVSESGHLEYDPHHPDKPAVVTTSEFMAALNDIQSAHHQNVDCLNNPSPAVPVKEFHQQTSTAEELAQTLSDLESQGLLPALHDLAHGQEVILYATSRLRAALSAWIDAVHNRVTYDEDGSRVWWLNCLMWEVVRDP